MTVNFLLLHMAVERVINRKVFRNIPRWSKNNIMDKTHTETEKSCGDEILVDN